jgi:hypothetical protein
VWAHEGPKGTLRIGPLAVARTLHFSTPRDSCPIQLKCHDLSPLERGERRRAEPGAEEGWSWQVDIPIAQDLQAAMLTDHLKVSAAPPANPHPLQPTPLHV